MKRTALSLILFVSFLAGFAQDEPAPEGRGFQRDKMFVGGNFGLTISSDYTLINVSPQVGYRFTNFVAAGLGINGQYINERFFDPASGLEGKQELGVVGLNLFGRIFPIEQLMIQVQPEANYVFGNIKYEAYNGRPAQTTKADAVIVPSLLIGGGAVFPSGKGAFMVSVFYDVLQKPNSPYGAAPFYSFGYNVSL